ncbi:MAG: FMN-dependent NADH-azoreductase [Leptospirillum sp.]
MPTLLQIDSSPMGEISISRCLTRAFSEEWQKAHPDGRVLTRDLAKTTMPPVDAEWVAANYTPRDSRTPRQKVVLSLSAKLAREVIDADEYVIGVPMHNWGPSSLFKLWTDQIILFGETVLITPSGLVGALDGRKATIVVTAGRAYGPGSPNASRNHLVPWIRTFFGNLGVDPIRFVFADGTEDVRKGRIDRAAYLSPHIEAIRGSFANSSSS